MKKHPVDDLFKSKLSNWEKQPSSEAWSRIAGEKKNSERKIGIWLWYAAASILVATTAGYLVWQGNARQSAQIENSIAKTDQLKNADLPISDAVAAKDSANDIEKSPEIKNFEEAVAADIKSESNIPVVSDEPEKQPESEIKIVENERVAVVPIVKDVVQPESTVSESLKKEALPQIAFASNKPEVKEDNRTIVVNVVAEEMEEKPKTSRFTKVFRQLKNVRAGDPVDWQEVGFNPKDIVAKVDDRIRNTEGEISEKYQNIKHKTKL